MVLVSYIKQQPNWWLVYLHSNLGSLNGVGRVDGIMMASGLIEIHKMSWESKGTPPNAKFSPQEKAGLIIVPYLGPFLGENVASGEGPP